MSNENKKKRLRPQMVVYHNPTDQDIEFEVATTPEGPLNIVECLAGGRCRGPAAYERAFKREGLVLGERPGKPKPVAPPADKPTRESRYEIEPESKREPEAKTSVVKPNVVKPPVEVKDGDKK